MHSAHSVRVDDLLAEGAAREIRPLRDVENVGEGRLVDGAAVDGPEAAEDAEEGRFSAAVGADDEEMIALFEGEGEGGHEHVAVRGDDGHVDEGDVFALEHLAAALEHGGVAFSAAGRDEVLVELAGLDVVHDPEEGGYARGVAR